MFDCIIFDFDETLVSFGRYINWEKAYRRTIDLCLRRGVPKEILGKSKGNPLSFLSHMREELFRILPKEEASKILEEVTRIMDIEEFEALSKATVVPGCEEILRWLRSHNVRVGVVSPHSEQITSYLLRKLKLKGFIRSIVGRSPNLRIKPHPEQVLLCLERMECPKERTALITVDEDGVRAAKTSGIHVIVVLSGSTHSISNLLDARTDSIVEDFKALLSLLQQL